MITVVLALVGIVVLGVALLMGAIQLGERLQRPGNERYRAATDKIVDESLGIWAPESMIARDRRRGRGHFAKARGVREL